MFITSSGHSAAFGRLPGRRGMTVVAASAAAFAGTAAVNAGSAQASALCRFATHITLSSPVGGAPASGSFRSDGLPDSSCSGTLAGSLIGTGGSFELTGTYDDARLGEGDTCILGFASQSLSASIPKMLGFFVPNGLKLSLIGQWQRATSVLDTAGTGTVGTQPVSFTGAGSFTPDPGQSCASGNVASGFLVENLAVVDGLALAGADRSADHSSGVSGRAKGHTARHASRHHRGHHRHHQRHQGRRRHRGTRPR
jgi:hypothetical protein